MLYQLSYLATRNRPSAFYPLIFDCQEPYKHHNSCEELEHGIIRCWYRKIFRVHFRRRLFATLSERDTVCNMMNLPVFCRGVASPVRLPRGHLLADENGRIVLAEAAMGPEIPSLCWKALHSSMVPNISGNGTGARSQEGRGGAVSSLPSRGRRNVLVGSSADA